MLLVSYGLANLGKSADSGGDEGQNLASLRFPLGQSLYFGPRTQLEPGWIQLSSIGISSLLRSFTTSAVSVLGWQMQDGQRTHVLLAVAPAEKAGYFKTAWYYLPLQLN